MFCLFECQSSFQLLHVSGNKFMQIEIVIEHNHFLNYYKNMYVQSTVPTCNFTLVSNYYLVIHSCKLQINWKLIIIFKQKHEIQKIWKQK